MSLSDWETPVSCCCLAAEAAPRYASALTAYNAVDFDDLLVFTLKLFREFPEVLERWRERCRHILVDEFQDTNAVQYRLVALLAGPAGNLTVVGDDDQSIYGWRGALPGNILDFTADWPTAKVITLDQNYRSTGHILAAANTIISRNPARREKNLWSDLGDGIPVTVLACKDAEDEANAVIERIIGLTASDKAKPADCAVIFRTNAQSRPFEDVLRRHRMRYVVIGGMRFYDRKEVRDLVAYLQAIHNPRDEVSLLRVVNFPPRGIGHETIHKLQAASLAEKRPLAEVMADAGAVSGVGERQARALGSAGESAASIQVAATTLAAVPPPATVPSAPSGVGATGGMEQVTVTWPAVTGATSYNVYWSTSPGVTTATGTLIAGVSSPYVHARRTASTAYFYIVTAVNSAGESSASAEATATTSAPPLVVPAAPTGVAAVGGQQLVTVSWNPVSGATSYNLYWSTTTGVTVGTGTKIAGVSMGRFDSSTQGVGKGAVIDPASIDPQDPVTHAQVAWVPFTAPPGYGNREDAVIYEVHVRDFTILAATQNPPGTYQAFTERLDHVAALGATHVQLLPVLAYYYGDEGSRAVVETARDTTGNNYNWGYDPQSWFSPDGMYSRVPEDPLLRVAELMTLVNEAHRRGLGVLLDVVYNHTAAPTSSPRSRPATSTGAGIQKASCRRLASRAEDDRAMPCAQLLDLPPSTR